MDLDTGKINRKQPERSFEMKKLLTIVCTLVFMVISTVSFADTKQPVKKSKRALEGTVKTRIGKLKFIKGYPSDKTIKKLHSHPISS